MILIIIGVVIFVIAVSLAPKQTQEAIARPKESEHVQSDICDELNELEAKILKDANGMSVEDLPYNEEIFAKQNKIINYYYRIGIDIDMDIASQRWKVK